MRVLLPGVALPREVLAVDAFFAEDESEACAGRAGKGVGQPSEPSSNPAIKQKPNVREYRTTFYYRLKLAPMSEMSSSARLRTSSACR